MKDHAGSLAGAYYGGLLGCAGVMIALGLFYHTETKPRDVLEEQQRQFEAIQDRLDSIEEQLADHPTTSVTKPRPELPDKSQAEEP